MKSYRAYTGIKMQREYDSIQLERDRTGGKCKANNKEAAGRSRAAKITSNNNAYQ
jgi:hypothetical protein